MDLVVHPSVALVARRAGIQRPEAATRCAQMPVECLGLLKGVEFEDDRVAPITTSKFSLVDRVRVKAEAFAPLAKHCHVARRNARS